LLRIWLIGSVVALTALAVWAFAPVLVFLALLGVALGLLSALMIWLARALQARRERRQGKGLH
jgi:membrane protein implicated in regulation of membrane protease activity